jgi:hypothetical protein
MTSTAQQIRLKQPLTFFTFTWPCIVTNLLIIEPTRSLISQIYFGMKLYMFRAVPLSIISSYSLYTQQWYMVYAVPSWSCCCCSKAVCMTYTIAECTVNNCWWWTEELPETCRVSFQNKFEKLVHLVGFIIRTTLNTFAQERPSFKTQIHLAYCLV